MAARRARYLYGGNPHGRTVLAALRLAGDALTAGALHRPNNTSYM